jgi:hypothetical protein
VKNIVKYIVEFMNKEMNNHYLVTGVNRSDNVSGLYIVNHKTNCK